MDQVNLEFLQNAYIVIAAKGAKSLESYDLDDLRVMDEELDQGVKAVYSDESEGIVAFLFLKGVFAEEEAEAWMEAAEKEGINLGVPRGRGKRFLMASARPLVAALPDVDFGTIYVLIGEALDDEGLTLPDGSFRWPWLIEVYPNFCIVESRGRLYRLPYTLDDQNKVQFGEPVEVRRAYVEVPTVEGGEGLSGFEQAGDPQAFVVRLRDVPEGFQVPTDGEGLIWKEIFRVSRTYRGENEVLEVSQEIVDETYRSFQAGVLDMVPITSEGHFEELGGFVPIKATDGIVAQVMKSGGSLYAGLDLRDPVAREKVELGLVSSCSVYIWPEVVDRRDGSVWPWVLWHLLLTNYAQLPGLKEYGEGPGELAASADARKIKTFVEEGMPERNQENQEPTAAAVELTDADRALLAELRSLQEQGVTAEGLREMADATRAQQEQVRQQARDLEVRSIVAAMEGSQAREDVVVVENRRHYPAVVAAVERVLRENQAIVASLSQEGRSVLDQLVLAVINALPAEARLALGQEPDRPDRSPEEPKEPQQPVGARVVARTTPLSAEEYAEVSDEQVEGLLKKIGMGTDPE
jgi:hypothetical protein